MEDLENTPSTPFVMTVHRLEEWEHWGNMLMRPLMHIAMGTLSESPQRTHRWNHQPLKTVEGGNLDRTLMVHEEGDPTACAPWRFGLPTFYVPLLGGWRRYVVVEPVDPTRPWHPGWMGSWGSSVSRIIIEGPARFLVGPASSRYFGIDAERKQELKIQRIGYGRIGDRSKYRHLPLF